MNFDLLMLQLGDLTDHIECVAQLDTDMWMVLGPQMTCEGSYRLARLFDALGLGYHAAALREGHDKSSYHEINHQQEKP